MTTTHDIDALRQQFRELAKACDLPMSEFKRRCRGVMAVNARLADRRPQDWVAAGNIIARSIVFRDWPWDQTPCCGDVKLLDCVCRFAYHCQRHGTKHVGSHE